MFNSLRAKLLAGFIPFVLLLIALGAYAIYSFHSLADITSTGLEQNSESVLANLSMYESLVRLDAAQLRMLSGEVEAGKQTLSEEPAQFYQALQKAQQALEQISSEERQTVGSLLVKVELAWDDYQKHLAVFTTLIAKRPQAARALYDSTLVGEYNSMRDLNVALSEQNYLAFQSAKKTAVDRSQNATIGVVLVAIVAVLLGIGSSYLISRKTTEPLRSLIDTVKHLQAGNLSARIPIASADEIGDLAYEFNRLSERLQQFEAININEIVREKQKSEAILESIEDPLLLFDAEGQLLLMNRAAEGITGITEQTALGRPLWQLFRDKKMLKDLERAIEQAAGALGKEDHQAPPIVSLLRAGRTRYYRLRIARIVSSTSVNENPSQITATKPIVGILVFFNDITHFKELDKMKSDFIAKVSHEFRTPLTSMTMSLDILGEELIGKLNEEQHDVIRTSKQDAKRLSKLIRDLLTLARLESTKQQTEYTEVTNLHDQTSQIVRSLTPMFQEKGIELIVDRVSSERIMIAADHYASIVSNLLSNALKYTPPMGRVWLHVEYERERSMLHIIVKDTGIGIAPEDQKRIFDKFVQVKPTNTSTPGSVGLGLAIVMELASRYQGVVDLQSEVGKGSTFTIDLVTPRAMELETERIDA